MSEYVVRTNGTTNYNIRVSLMQGSNGKSNVSATTAPGITDDLNSGYTISSNWYNLTTDKAYTCLDHTVGAAVWKEITPAVVEGEAGNVTNGDNHDHLGGDGAQIAYSSLGGIPETFNPTTHSHTYSNQVSSTTSGNLPAFSGTSGTLVDSGYDPTDFAVTGHTHTYQPGDATLDALAGVTTGSNTLQYWSGTDTASTTTFTTLAQTLLGQSTTSGMRSTLEITAGTGSSSWTTLTDKPAPLVAIGGVTAASNTLAYFTSSDTASTTTFTSIGRDVIASTSTAALASTLGFNEMATKKSTFSNVDPTVYSDMSEGYATGSIWINTDANRAWICLDALDNNAVWGDVMSGGGGPVSYNSLTEVPSTFPPSAHNHAQSNTHDSPDTDASTTSIHHTIGTGTYQAAAGDHGHSSFSGTYQAKNTNLDALSGITGASNTYVYFTGAGSMTTASITTAGRDLIDDATPLAQRTTLGTPALCGFENRTDSAFSMSGSNFQITTATNYNIWTGGTKYNFTTTQSVAISTDNSLHFVYFNTSGALTASTTPWVITSDNVPVALVYKTGSTYAIFDERHGHTRDRHWHNWAHDTIGARYESGGTGTFTNTTLSILRCYIHDEDIDIDTGGTKTACRIWYRNTGGASMTFESNIATPYKVTGGVIRYDSGGTLTDVSNTNFVCNYVYCTNDIDYPIAVVVGQNNHNTIANARLEAFPTIPNLPTMEWKILYRVIYKNVSGTPTYQEAGDYRTSSSLPAGGSTTTNASSVLTATNSFSGNVLTTAETSVQSALDILDTYLNNRRMRPINLTLGDGTTVPTAGTKAYLTFPFACTLITWHITSDASGSAQVDLKRSGTTIVGAGNKPALSTAQRANATIASWTSVAIAANDEIEFYLDSATTVKRLNLMIKVYV